MQELAAIAERVQELPALDEHYEAGSRAALHHLERSLFETAPARIDPGSSVRLLEAGGERAEAELVAAEVLDLLRAGVPGEEIAVVYRSLTRSAPLIERVFQRYGIPLAGEHRVPFAHTALGRSVLALARCALLEPGRASAEDLLAYLRSPGLLERIEIADALEADVRRDGLGTAAEARERLGWELGEIDSLRRASDLRGRAGGSRAATARGFPTGALRPTWVADAELDARALATLLRALAELAELREAPARSRAARAARARSRSPPGRRCDRERCCSPIRWRSGPAGSRLCSSAGCRRASSRCRA